MNLLPIVTPSPLLVVLFRWTLLLSLGWTIHGLLRNHHSRWRLILWRCILCFGLVLPLLHFIPIPGFKIPVQNLPAPATANFVPRVANPTSTESEGICRHREKVGPARRDSRRFECSSITDSMEKSFHSGLGAWISSRGVSPCPASNKAFGVEKKRANRQFKSSEFRGRNSKPA